MDNPHEQLQIEILRRISATVERLNEGAITLNRELEVANGYSRQVKLVGELCDKYHQSVQFHLEATGENKEKDS